MKTTELETPEDLRWLCDTHLKGATYTTTHKVFGSHSLIVTRNIYPDRFVHATLHGNEDAPVRIELFKKDHYRCVPHVWVLVGEAFVFLPENNKGAGKLRALTTREKAAGCL